MEGLLLLALLVLSIPVLLIVALVSISGLKRRVGDLESQVSRLSMQVAEAHREGAFPRSSPSSQPADASPAPSVPPPPDASAPVPSPSSLPPPPAVASVTPPPVADGSVEVPTPWQATPIRRPPPPPLPPRPDLGETVSRWVRRWFTTGNVPVKVGMLVLLAGVAALLKYASDQGWLRLPIEFRLLGVSAAALGALVCGWKQRFEKPAFALALQGGAIGILLLVIFAAAKMYGLIPIGMAFALSVVLIAGLGVLAVKQDSRTLAILGVLAGFMAPIWLSDGSGNHVALFGYYALLNLAIFGVAWVKPWRVLILLGFVFTFGIGVLWGVLKYRPELYASTQPFLLLFFLIYLAIPILHARRRVPRQRDPIDGCLLFGLPLVAFSLQAALMPHQPLNLALCAVAAAALYAGLAAWLRGKPQFKAIFEAHALLAVGFATLAVPLAFSARVTSAIFALEGAALVWFGLRQQRCVPLWTGMALQLVAGMVFIGAYVGVHRSGTDIPLLNARFLAMALLALAGLASTWSLWRARRGELAALLYLWGLLWWCAGAVLEIDRFAPEWTQWPALLAFAAFTGWLAAEAWRHVRGAALALTVIAALAVAAPIAIAQTIGGGQPFAGWGAAAWGVYAVLGLRSLVCLRGGEGRVAEWGQVVWWLVWPLVVMLVLVRVADRFHLSDAWQFAAIWLPWVGAWALAQFRPAAVSHPLGERFAPRIPTLVAVYALVCGAGFLFGLTLRGSAAPLPWLPLFSPLELLQLAMLLLAFVGLRQRDAPRAPLRRFGVVAGVIALAFITAMTMRGVHFWGGVEWGPGMFGTSLAQMALTVVWSVLGVVGWIIGSRRGHRGLWLAGALLMGVVLAKLVLVDRQHLGNLLGIGSFIAYGLLCTVVGYFAPAPLKDPSLEEVTS